MMWLVNFTWLTVLAGLFLGCTAVLSEAPPLAGVSRRACRARNSDTRRRELCACRAGAGGSARPGVRAAGLCAVLLAAVVSQNRRSEHTVSLQHRAGEWPAPVRRPCPYERHELDGTCPGKDVACAEWCATKGVETRLRLRHRETCTEDALRSHGEP